jgi:hypothetical protein
MIITKQFKIATWNLNAWGILYIPDNIQGKVPIVIFNHGAGETGSSQASTSKLYTHGPLNFIQSGWKPNFIVVALQHSSWSPTPTSNEYILKNDPDILNKWDGKTGIVTGLSAGGETTVQFMDNYDYPDFSYVIMSPAGNATLKNPVKGNKTWYFSGDKDYHFTDTASALSKLTNGRLTIYPGGHSGWNTFYNPNYKEIIDGNSLNIYDWGLSTPVVINKPPIALAGPDQTINISETLLEGNGTDEDGTIVSAFWLQKEGPVQANILSPNGFTTQVTGLEEGRYVFSITVIDNKGDSATDDVVVVREKVVEPVKNKLIISDSTGVLYEVDVTGDIKINI